MTMTPVEVVEGCASGGWSLFHLQRLEERSALEEEEQRVSWVMASTGSMEEYEKRAEVVDRVGF